MISNTKNYAPVSYRCPPSQVNKVDTASAEDMLEHATLMEKPQSRRGLFRRLFGRLLPKKKSKKAITNEAADIQPFDSYTGSESDSGAAEEVPIVLQDPDEWAYNVWKRKGLMVGTPSDGTQRGERRRKQE